MRISVFEFLRPRELLCQSGGREVFTLRLGGTFAPTKYPTTRLDNAIKRYYAAISAICGYTPYPMRIIAGTFRTRRLIGPDSMTTRPITDRAKQSLFDALTCAVAIPDAVVLDCFSGTGSLGLECLSRGAKRAIFVERDRNALDGLRKNIGALRVEQVCDVLSADAYHSGLLLPGKLRGQQLGLAFIDPPYAHMETSEGRGRVDELIRMVTELMAPESLMILRHPTEVALDDMAIRPRVVRVLNYGAMAITWLSAGAAPAS